MRLLRKAAIVPIAIAGALLAMAVPAAAASNPMTVTNGTLITPIGNFGLGNSASPPCTGSGGITVDIASGSAPWDTDVSAVSSSSSVTISGQNYWLDLSMGPNSQDGEISGGGSVTQDISLFATITATTTPTGCTRNANPECLLLVDFVGLSGTVSNLPSGGSVSAGTTATLSGSGSVAQGPCNSPFDAVTSASLSSLELTR